MGRDELRMVLKIKDVSKAGTFSTSERVPAFFLKMKNYGIIWRFIEKSVYLHLVSIKHEKNFSYATHHHIH